MHTHIYIHKCVYLCISCERMHKLQNKEDKIKIYKYLHLCNYNNNNNNNNLITSLNAIPG